MWVDWFGRIMEDGGSRWSWMLQLVAVDVEWEDVEAVIGEDKFNLKIYKYGNEI